MFSYLSSYEYEYALLLVERGLLHDAQELVRVDLPVAIAVRLVDHLLQLLIRHVLAKFLRDALQVAKRNLP